MPAKAFPSTHLARCISFGHIGTSGRCRRLGTVVEDRLTGSSLRGRPPVRPVEFTFRVGELMRPSSLMSIPSLFLTVGLPGCGKTTAARQFEAEHAALRLTKDEWMKAL